MFRFSEIDPDHLIKLLKAGKLDEDLDDLFSQFWDLSPRVQFEVVKYVKERSVSPSVGVLEETFKADHEDIRKFLNLPHREFFVPVVDPGGRGLLVRGLSVRGTQALITNQRHLLRSMEVIKSFLGEGFALFFDSDMEGESYMLPAAVSLYIERPPPDAVFTGRIDEKGNIYEVNGLPKKRKAAQNQGLRLVEPSRLSRLQDLKDWCDARAYHVPVFITNSLRGYEGELGSFYAGVRMEDVDLVLNHLEVINGIDRKDLVLRTGQLSPERAVWIKAVTDFYALLKRLERSLHGREIPHIGIKGPASLAFSLGSAYGSQKPFVFYHFQDSTYHPIEVKNVRFLKERVKSYEHIEAEILPGGDLLVIVLSMAHHDPESAVIEFTRDKNPTYLVLRHRRTGNLPPEEMVLTARECASKIQDMRSEKNYREFHFFFACPVPVAFMVGVAFGFYNDGYVYQYYGDRYEKVVSFRDIRNLREG
ncbi:MAG: SAVED domain-containing protein [Aquificota bacterium]|nr:SAVED domain-containing protein [Aquificota bacterium]